MFARIKDFIYRHRRKFLIGTAVIGGITLLSRYAEHKLLEWHDTQTRMLVEKQKRRQHYENTQRTANATVMSLAGSMKELVVKDLDSEALLLAIREQPQHKHNIWEQLKVVGFSRAVSVVYISSLVASAIRVQLMLLGGYTFGDLVHVGHAGTPISQALQQKYLTAVHYLVEEGVPKLTQHVTRAVTRIAAGLPLTQQLTLSQLEAIFQEMKLSLAGEATSQYDADSRQCKLDQWPKYVMQVPVPPEDDSAESRVLYNMLLETCDILSSEDFTTVMDTLIQHGFSHLLDRMADFYPLSKVQHQGESAAGNWVNNINREEPLSVDGSNSLVPKLNPSQGSSFLNNCSLPVAKLVPVLSGVVHGALSPAPGQLLQKILMEDKLETLGANVYEAFAVPLSH